MLQRDNPPQTNIRLQNKLNKQRVNYIINTILCCTPCHGKQLNCDRQTAERRTINEPAIRRQSQQ